MQLSQMVMKTVESVKRNKEGSTVVCRDLTNLLIALRLCALTKKFGESFSQQIADKYMIPMKTNPFFEEVIDKLHEIEFFERAKYQRETQSDLCNSIMAEIVPLSDELINNEFYRECLNN